MKFRVMAAALVLLLAGGVSAQSPAFVAPKLKLDGVGQYEAGEYVSVTVSPDGPAPANLVSTSYLWRVYEIVQDPKTGVYTDRCIRVKNDQGSVSFFAVTAKNYRVECIATSLFVAKTDGKVTDIGTKTQRLFGTVTIGVPPPPSPQPGPAPTPPGPAPTFPDGKYKLAKTSYDLATSKVAADAKRPAAAKALAASFTSIKSAIAAGTLSDPKDILTKTLAANQSALANAGADRSQWGAFFSGLQDVLFSLYDQRQLNAASDFGTAFDEISQGLSKVQ